MIVGIPREIKNNENRVAITPAGVAQLVHAGQEVIIETNAGLGSGFSDQEYKVEGAKIVVTAKEAWSADMVMKVKEPLEEEFGFFREGLVLFTYLHLAPEPELTKALIDKKVIAIGYETVQLDNGALPLLSPMSEVAGRMAVQIGAQFLEKFEGGKGILLGGVPGVEAAKVTVVGGGIVGTNAAKIALGMGARVTLLDINPDRLRYLDEVFGGRVQTLMSNRYNIAKAVKEADLLVGAVLIPGARAPRLVTEDMVKEMEEGSVIVDVAIDQGGSIETIDRITTHSEPTYVKHGVVHYAVANMPGAVARTSTLALTNSTMPYAVQLAEKGYLEAARANKALAKGFNVIDGKVTFKGVADALGYQYVDINDVLAGGKTV
jgi:alanine dehydrogenase